MSNGWGTDGSSVITIVFLGISCSFWVSFISSLDFSSSQLDTLSAMDTSSWDLIKKIVLGLHLVLQSASISNCLYYILYFHKTVKISNHVTLDGNQLWITNAKTTWTNKGVNKILEFRRNIDASNFTSTCITSCHYLHKSKVGKKESSHTCVCRCTW